MTPQQIKDNAPFGAMYYCRDGFYRYNYESNRYEIYMHGIGWIGVMLGLSTVLIPLQDTQP